MRVSRICLFFSIALLSLFPAQSLASLTDTFSARGGAYGIWLEPRGKDAELYSKGSLGFGLNFIAAPRKFGKFFAANAGFEYVEMKRQDIRIKDKDTGFTWEQQTRQIYRRFYLGGFVGHQGHGFLRPHAGANIALLYYSIYTDAVVEDLFEEDQKENVSHEGRFGFGYDVTLGLEFNFKNSVFTDLGVRYLQSLSIPQQLGADSEFVHPQYLQFYFGVMIGAGN